MEKKVIKAPVSGVAQRQVPTLKRSKDRGRAWDLTVSEMKNRLFKMWTGDPNLNLLPK